MYAHLLVAADISAEAKQAAVDKLLESMVSPTSLGADLRGALDEGLASAGIAFRQYRGRMVAFLLAFASAWKGLDPAIRATLLDDPWSFKSFVATVPMTSAQSEREALLHLVHPEAFESIVSSDVKRRISAAFPEFTDEVDVDRRLLAIREGLTRELGHDVQWWRDEAVKDRWYPTGTTDPEPDPVDGLDELARELLLDVAYLRRVRRLLERKRQIVFYGPPGTGKTYVARRLADLLVGDADLASRVRLVQFHPSYAYEDFVEGYRPDPATNGATFSLQAGPLRRIAEAARGEPDATFVLLIAGDVRAEQRERLWAAPAARLKEATDVRQVARDQEMKFARRSRSDRQHAICKTGVISDALAEGAVEEFIEQPHAACEVDVQQFFANVRPVMLNSVAMRVDRSSDYRLGLVQYKFPTPKDAEALGEAERDGRALRVERSAPFIHNRFEQHLERVLERKEHTAHARGRARPVEDLNCQGQGLKRDVLKLPRLALHRADPPSLTHAPQTSLSAAPATTW